jgi:hypothetical protein
MEYGIPDTGVIYTLFGSAGSLRPWCLIFVLIVTEAGLPPNWSRWRLENTVNAIRAHDDAEAELGWRTHNSSF